MSSSKFDRYLELLCNDANIEKMKNNDINFKHIAGVIVNGKLMTIGINNLRSTLCNEPCFSLHAEIDAIRRWLVTNNMYRLLPLLSDSDIIAPHKRSCLLLNTCAQEDRDIRCSRRFADQHAYEQCAVQYVC